MEKHLKKSLAVSILGAKTASTTLTIGEDQEEKEEDSRLNNR